MKKHEFPFKISLLLISILLIWGLIFQSCEKQENAVIEQQNKQFTVKDGILVFNTVQDFFVVKSQVANFSNAERENWEKEIGFKSQKSIFNEIVQAETDIDVVNQAKYTYAEAKSMDPALLHSELYNKYLKAGVIQIINAGTEDEYWDMPLSQKTYMEIVNEKGLFAAADKIYSVNGGVIKYISDGDFSKIPKLLSTNLVDKINGIEFLNQKAKDSSPGLVPQELIWNYGGTSNKRISLQIYLSTTYFDWVTCDYYFYHEVYVKNQDKNWLGNWKYKLIETWITADWSVSLWYNNGFTFANSWSYHNSIGDFKASLNPETGATPPYQALFVAHYPYPDPDPLLEEGWEPIWNYGTTFQAVRIGGASGIYATISF